MENLLILDKFGYNFQYPGDATIYAYNSDSLRKGLEIHFHRDSLSYKMLIEPVTGLSLPEQMAYKTFNRQEGELLTDDIPPHEFQTLHGTGWRFRKVFTDGFQVPFLQETAFFEQPGGLVKIQMTAAPRHFSTALLEFEVILQSLTYATN